MVVAERCLAIIITTGAGPTTLVKRKQKQTTPPAGRIMKETLILKTRTLARNTYRGIFFKYLKGCHVYTIPGADKSWIRGTH